ncbi:Isoprenylcysteine carboxyl methyltransferase (ICMT) family protein [Rubripirellula tenax]|uniref:Isoprenylcysteine carboxyl methyltransferase (ICMT) family protein n=1 Tax=Rubripirellula tenax TaxID=2528015 RepID=A0A5C6EB11_9BACT|nr:isoprenylcysteine carboxylmethyltransferase family protein [Rubripirellula tenax]TWU46152.1 Isoprenylcysteine carboxyl methyltransferase (ICMT) family protein [Rubripirellula tenax]
MYHVFLIVAQFALAAILVLSATWLPFPWAIMLIALPGIVLAMSAWLTMGLFKLRVHPTTNEDTRLIRSGPYAVVRHPMYAGLMWFTAALLLSGFAWWRLAAWIGLSIVLASKASVEELAMVKRFEEYRDYQSKVGRLVPRLPFASRGK